MYTFCPPVGENGLKNIAFVTIKHDSIDREGGCTLELVIMLSIHVE